MSDSLQPHGLQHARLPVLHRLPGFAQTHVHGVDDVIQPSHPLSPSSPPALSLSQHHKQIVTQLQISFPVSEIKSACSLEFCFLNYRL